MNTFKIFQFMVLSVALTLAALAEADTETRVSHATYISWCDRAHGELNRATKKAQEALLTNNWEKATQYYVRGLESILLSSTKANLLTQRLAHLYLGVAQAMLQSGVSVKATGSFLDKAVRQVIFENQKFDRETYADYNYADQEGFMREFSSYERAYLQFAIRQVQFLNGQFAVNLGKGHVAPKYSGALYLTMVNELLPFLIYELAESLYVNTMACTIIDLNYLKEDVSGYLKTPQSIGSYQVGNVYSVLSNATSLLRSCTQ